MFPLSISPSWTLSSKIFGSNLTAHYADGHPRLWQLGILPKERQAHQLASHVGRTFPDASGFPLNSWLQLSTLSRLNTKNITSHSGKASFDSEQQTEMYSTLFVGKKNPLQLLLASMHEVILPVFYRFYRTRVRSLGMLVSDSLPKSLTAV